MSTQLPAPRRTNDGISFTVVVESVSRECLIRDEALQHLSTMKMGNGKSADTMDIFVAFENTIQGVARRLVSAGVKGTPLVMTANTFFRPPHTS
jgi:hypothetical protein